MNKFRCTRNKLWKRLTWTIISVLLYILLFGVLLFKHNIVRTGDYSNLYFAGQIASSLDLNDTETRKGLSIEHTGHQGIYKSLTFDSVKRFYI